MTSFEQLIILFLGALSIFIVIVFVLMLRKNKTDTSQDFTLKNLQEQIRNIQTELKGSIEKNLDFLQKQSGVSNQIIRETTKEFTSKLERVEATTKQVVNFATQLQSLENILKNPKQRGVLGEYFLESTLANVLAPGQFKMQYYFKNGDAVDAVIFIRDKIIPIDAKFSLEKYNMIQKETDQERRTALEREFKKDIQNRIDETSKYIRPNENTTDFALMFIPAEGVYYNLLVSNIGTIDVSSKNLIEYAFNKKVVMVSPNTFIAYLQTILQALKALTVEENIKDIIKGLRKLNTHYLNCDSHLQRIGKQIEATSKTYADAYKQFSLLGNDMNKLTNSEKTPEQTLLDKSEDLS
ncbi:DNA recombination protein RmuC [Patescibacteria group bacterium]|nr:DNA recombination protein RmuC [Patescibacteria group bacterium]MBU1922318.1 DNA recombination protein RmuC [Patescibacteria group bacterium]